MVWNLFLRSDFFVISNICVDQKKCRWASNLFIGSFDSLEFSTVSCFMNWNFCGCVVFKLVIVGYKLSRGSLKIGSDNWNESIFEVTISKIAHIVSLFTFNLCLAYITTAAKENAKKSICWWLRLKTTQNVAPKKGCFE